ncbi:MAG TPA: TonB-dependent receptor, partial [Gemmatimonadales bacterium]
ADGRTLRGAGILLEGTAFAARTDSLGTFVIRHVPAGRYDVLVHADDRAVGTWPGIRVPGGATVRVELREGSAEVHAETVDATTQTVIGGEQLAQLPIDDARQGLPLATGVMLAGTTQGIDQSAAVSVRGSGPEQTGFFIDGAPARSNLFGGPAVSLAMNGIDDVSVTAGLNGAATADARGGAVAYGVPMGGSHTRASFEARTDAPFSNVASVGLNTFALSAGGPLLPHLSWFVAGELQGQESSYRGAGADSVPAFALGGIDTTISYRPFGAAQPVQAVLPTFVQYAGACGGTGNATTTAGQSISANYGAECHGARLPMDWTTQRQAVAKLAYSYGGGSSLSFTGAMSDRQQRFYPGGLLLDSLAYSGTRRAGGIAIVNWAQRISSSLTLLAHGSLLTAQSESGHLEARSEVTTRDPALGLEFGRLTFVGADSVGSPVTDLTIRSIRTNGPTSVPFQGNTALRLAQPFRFNPYGEATGWRSQGLDGGLTLADEQQTEGRLQLDWDAGVTVRVSAGVDASSVSERYYDAVSMISEDGVNAFHAEPRRTGAFATVRYRVGELTLDAGLRGDRFDAGSPFPIVPGRIYSSLGFGVGSDPAAQEDSILAHSYAPSQPRTVLSPSARLGYAMAPGAHAFLAVGQQAVPPAGTTQFGFTNADLGFSDIFSPFGRDVDVLKSTVIEGGLSLKLGAGTTATAALYSKTNALPYSFRIEPIFDPLQQRTQNINVLTTSGLDGHGADVRLDWLTGPWSGRAAWSYSRASATILGGPTPFDIGSPAQAAFAAVTWRGPALGTSAPLVSGMSVTGVWRVRAGIPYTRIEQDGSGQLASAEALGFNSTAIEPFNSSTTPWLKTLDLRVTKQVHGGMGHWTVFAEALNILNLSNLTDIFATTGTDTDSLFRARVIEPEIQRLESAAGAALSTNGIDLAVACAGIGTSITLPDCIALQRAENRFGNGDGIFTSAEYTRAFEADYDLQFGPSTLHGPGRTARVGLSIAL